MSRELVSVHTVTFMNDTSRMTATYHVNQDEFEARRTKAGAWEINWRYPALTRMFKETRVLRGEPNEVMAEAMRLRRQAARRAGVPYHEYWTGR